MTPKNHVYILEDDLDLSASLGSIVQEAGYGVSLYNNAKDFLEQAHALLFPAVILADMILPSMSGVEMYDELLRRKITVPVVFLSGESSNLQIITAYEQGAVKFLLKPVDLQEMLDAIALGIERSKAQILAAQNQAKFRAEMEKLSPREKEVFELLSQGLSHSEVQEKLNISLPTAKQYKTELMRKLGLKKLSELVELRRSVM